MKKFKPIGTLLDKMLSDFSDVSLNVIRMLSEISATICKSRIEKEMKQSEFAKYMGVSQGMISKWESGEYNFTIKQLCCICDRLEVIPHISFKKVDEDIKYQPNNPELSRTDEYDLHNKIQKKDTLSSSLKRRSENNCIVKAA